MMEELEKSMYNGAKTSTFEAARILRENMTFYEKLKTEFKVPLGGFRGGLLPELAGSNKESR